MTHSIPAVGRLVSAVIHPSRRGAERVTLQVGVVDRSADTLVLPRVTDLPTAVLSRPTRLVTARFGRGAQAWAAHSAMTARAHRVPDALAETVNYNAALLDARLRDLEARHRALGESLRVWGGVVDARRLRVLARHEGAERAVAVVQAGINRRPVAARVQPREGDVVEFPSGLATVAAVVVEGLPDGRVLVEGGVVVDPTDSGVRVVSAPALTGGAR